MHSVRAIFLGLWRDVCIGSATGKVGAKHSPDFFLDAIATDCACHAQVGPFMFSGRYTPSSPKAVRPVQVIYDCQHTCVAGAACWKICGLQGRQT